MNTSWKVEKTLDMWMVFLYSTSKDIISETHEDLYNTTVADTMTGATLIFYEEAIANRVLEALKHAMDLCRGKEPF